MRECRVCRSRELVKYVDGVDSEISIKSSSAHFVSRKPSATIKPSYWRCLSCSVLNASTVTDRLSLEAAYVRAPQQNLRLERQAAMTYYRLMSEFTSSQEGLVTGPSMVLDIGCGSGSFLRLLASRDFTPDQLTGLELSEKAIESADVLMKSRIKDKSLASFVENCSDKYDVICAFMVIEHVEDVNKFINACLQLLKSRGILLLVCHDYKSTLNRIMGSRSPIYDIEHLQIFDKASIRCFLEMSGFNDVRIRSYVNQYDLGYVMSGLGISVPDSLARIAVPLPAGNLFVVASR